MQRKDDRLCDLMKQGLATFTAPKLRTPKVERPIVACPACQDWHREGKHVRTVAERKALAKAGR
jgi:hypothetical protein